MAAIASAPPWNPEDDLLLKNAVEAGASLEALAKGAVRFSRKFTVRELRERWRSLLYDAEVSAQASARMAEFELCNPSASSKPGRFGVSRGGGSVRATKRRAESVRKQYYEMRKKLCSFNTFDLGFIDEPNDNTENLNGGNGLMDGSYAVGDHVENYFEFEAGNCSLLDNPQKDLCFSTSGSVKDANEHNINGEKNLVKSGDGLVDFRNCSSVAEAGTSHVLPDVPLWKTMEDVSAPEMPIDVGLEVKCQDTEQKLMHRDRLPGYNVDHSGLRLEERLPDEEVNRTVAISGDDFGDISDSLLNFANENESLAMDVDVENTDDKASYVGVKSVPLSSSKDAQKKDIPSVSVRQPENLDPKTFPAVSEAVCNAEKKDTADLLHSGEGNQQSISSSETNIPPVKSVPNPCSPELDYEMMECTLNSEDPEIPCNDDVIQPSDPVLSFTNQENRRQESISLKKEQSPAEFRMAGHRTVPTTSSHFPLVKPESFDSTHVASVSKRPNNLPADASRCRSAHTTPAFAANQVLKEEVMNGINSPITIRGEHALLSKEPGSTSKDVLEPEANTSRLYQDESEEEPDCGDDDIPYFSDIENMILEMDLSPDDEDSYLSKKVSRYQHEDAKRNIVRLEQCARSSMQRAIASQGALAVLYGRHMKQYIKGTEAILGRATEDNEVDIDLGREGRANKVSRRQAIIKMDEDGSFFLKNIGKSSIFLNGKEVVTGHRMCLSSSALIEISGMSFVFEMNHKSIRRYLVNVGKNSKEKYAKFEWSLKENQ